MSALALLKPGWQHLQSLQKGTRFYETYEWYESIAKSLMLAGDELLFFVVESEGQLIGVFPLWRRRIVRHGMRLVSLELPKNPHAVLCDFIIRSDLDRDEVISRFLEYLKIHGEVQWDVIRLVNVPIDSFASRLARRRSGALHQGPATGSSSQIGCTGSEDSYLSHLSGRFRRNLRRLEKKARKLHDVSLHCCTSAGNIEEGLHEFIDIENDSWKGEQRTSIAADDSLIQFYSSVSKLSNSTMYCRINLLRFGDKTVAGHFGIVADNTYFLLKVGFRKGYRKLSPGNILLLLVLRDLSGSQEIQVVDLVTCPKWADKWKSQDVPLYTTMIFARTAKGAVLRLVHNCRKLLLSILRKIR